MELIGNDLFAVKANFALSLDHVGVLMSLYQPLLSKKALALYFTLIARSHRNQLFETHHTLCETTQMRIEEIEQARIELEQFLLLRTMAAKKEKSSIYYYLVQAPKTFRQFLKHDLFSRLLIEKTGVEYVQKIKDAQEQDEQWKDMEDITSRLHVDFTSWTSEKENQYQALIDDVMDPDQDDPYTSYDILSYLRANDPQGFVVPHRDFTKQDVDFINSCGQLYDIPHDEMVKMLKNHYHRADRMLNREGLKSSCLWYQNRRKTISSVTIDKNDPLSRYQLPSVEFVRSILPNAVLSKSEIASFDRLKTEYGFTTDVFNALLELVWKSSQNFNYKFIDKMCAVWARSGIDTLDKALAQLKEPPKKTGPSKSPTARKPRIVEPMPVYSEQPSGKADADDEELALLLKSLEQKRQVWKSDKNQKH